MSKQKTVFMCGDCGNEYLRWQGQCPACKAWNTLKEQTVIQDVKQNILRDARPPAKAMPLSEIRIEGEVRFRTGMDELDRVLGGGAVAGSLVLVAGEPGIGKSTLLLQICDSLCRFSKVLYVSGEESAGQIKLRAERLRVASDNLFILSETNLDDIVNAAQTIQPDIIIVDSIQTMYRSDVNSSHGSVTQVKECTLTLMDISKRQGITVFVVGHVNKEGSIAGPKVLEHMVDCVLYFEGDRQMQYRILRAAKNRYGSTHEIGVFEMRDSGLAEVPNPSEALLAGRPRNVPGTCVVCTMEGSRPLLAEIQALVTPTTYNYPRRMSNGIDLNRAQLLLAILEKRGGRFMGNSDAYINVVGGISLDETASDLPALLALASSQMDKPVREGLAAFGEVGLAGELRPVTAVEQRLMEVRRLGFTTCIIPAQGTKTVKMDGLELIRVKHLRDAIEKAVQ